MKKKYFKYMIATLCLMGIVFFAHMLGKIQEVKKQEAFVEEQVSHVAMGTKEERVSEIVRLEKVLKEATLIRKKTRAKLLNQLAILNFQDSKYSNGLDYAAKSLYLAYEGEDYFRVAKNMVDIGIICIELGGTTMAEEFISQALAVPVEDALQEARIKEYAYVNLADLYSREKRGKEALRCILKAEKYEEKARDTYKENSVLKKIIAARALFYIEDIERAKGLLEEVREEVYASNEKIDLIISYLGVEVNVALYEKRYDEAIQIADKLIALCEKEEKWDVLIKYIENILEMMHPVEEDGINIEVIKDYEHRLIGYYHELVDEKNEKAVKFILNGYRDNLENFQMKERWIKQRIYEVIFLISISVLLAWLGVWGRRLLRQTHLDSLTKIYNRHKFEKEHKKLQKSKEMAGIIMIDIDYFKKMNDAYGHDYGDYVLREVAKVLKNAMGKGMKVFRYGGEEFCVLCIHLSKEDILVLAESLREEIEKMVLKENRRVTISLGVATSDDGENILKQADERLYQSKAKGRNCVTY